MLGDAPDPEADVQQRVRLSLARQLVLGMVIGSIKRKGLLHNRVVALVRQCSAAWC